MSIIKRENELINKFGLELLTKNDFPYKHTYINRKIFFACRGKNELKNMIKNRNFYLLTGIMPSYERIHLGTIAVIEAFKYFQKLANISILVIADLEALSTRGIFLDKSKEYALKYHIPSYLALGIDPQKTLFYYQSENIDLQKIAFDVSYETTLSELQAIYGDSHPSRILASTYQVADILFPQLYKTMYGLIPVGLDQDPHIRFCRDYIRRTRLYKFKQVSSVYVRSVPGLNGSEKMSKSDPENAIFLPEDDLDILKKKIWLSFSGGGATVMEHKEKGANLEIDVPYNILRFLLKDEKELNEIAHRYKSGEMLSGEIKEFTYIKLLEFLKEFNEKFSYFQDYVSKQNIMFINSYKEISNIV